MTPSAGVPNLKRSYKPPSASSTAASSKVGNKRTRIEQACNNCRALRRKCNAGSPCSACRDDKLACSYEGDVHPSERLTLARAVKRIAYLEERLRLYEGSSNDGDGFSRFSTEVFSTRRTTDKPDDDMVRALRGVNSLTIHPRLPEFYGGSSPNVIIKAVETSERTERPDSPESVDPHLPENRALLWLGGSSDLSFGKAPGPLLPARAVAEAYINCFFQTGSRIFPILNRKLFINTFNDFWNGLPTEGKGYEWWTAVMYMTIALGHQYSLIDSDSELRSRAISSPQDGEACFQLAKSSLAEVPFTGGDISAVNSLLLMFLWLYNSQRLHEAYTVMGLAANIGYGIGLHRNLQMDLENKPHIIGWCSSFWCLFTYEREIMSLLGRPCVVSAREVDIIPFSLENSPVDLQYLERMRQFAYVTWDTWDQVYSLVYKHSSVSERGNALRKADETFVIWYNSWYHDCIWAKEPHGIIVRLRFLHVRHLLYRAFLNLVVQKSQRQESISEDLLNLATTCIRLAIDLTKLTVSSIHLGCSVSGTLQGIFFHALGYQWNASVTLVLYANSVSAQEKLSPKLGSVDVLGELRSAVELFQYYAEAIPFAYTAGQKIEVLLHRGSDKTEHGVEVPDGHDSASANATEDVSEQMPDLDFSEFDFALDYFEDYSNPLSDLNVSLEPRDDDGTDFGP